MNTAKDIITTKPQPNYNVSEVDHNLELEMSVFPADQDSEILERERARGSKLENVYESKKEREVKGTPHTVIIQEANKQKKTNKKLREQKV